MDLLECQWCHGQNPPDQKACASCGAPLDVRNLVSDSGWRETPRLRDMAEFRFSGSVCQVEGHVVPVAEITLAADDSVFFEHHVLLWKDPTARLGAMGNQTKRNFAGMPHLISYASGPGRAAFSRDASGELVVLPLHPGMELDVREHAFLVASHTIQYSFVRIKGMVNLVHGGSGMWMDRFVTTDQPGVVILHGFGNVLQRTLQPGEKVQVEPGAFLYKDSSVTMNTVHLPVKTGRLRHGMYMAEMVGPGRIGIQSMYHHYRAGE